MTSLSDEEIINQVKENYEDVVVFLDGKYQKGIRGRKLFIMGSCLGKIIVLPNGEWYHSSLIGITSYNKEELQVEIDKLQNEVDSLKRSFDVYF